jgi:hypothetical protein
MDFKKELEPYMQGIYKEFGFKYTKSKREAILKKGNLILRVSISYVGYFRALHFEESSFYGYYARDIKIENR